MRLYLFLCLGLTSGWLGTSANAADTRWCHSAILDFATLPSIPVAYLGEALQEHGKYPLFHVNNDPFFKILPPLKFGDLPSGAAQDARVGSEALMGELLAGRVHTVQKPPRENEGAAYIGRVVAVDGRLLPGRSGHPPRVVYRLSILGPDDKIVDTDVPIHIVEEDSKISYRYEVLVLKDPETLLLPEPDFQTRRLMNSLPDGYYPPPTPDENDDESTGSDFFGSEDDENEDGEDDDEGDNEEYEWVKLTAAQAVATFHEVTSKPGWNRGLPAPAQVNPESLSEFIRGKLISYASYISKEGPLEPWTPNLKEGNCATFVTGVVVDATVHISTSGTFSLHAMLMKEEGIRHVHIQHVQNLFWHGKQPPNPYALTADEIRMLRALDLEPTFIFKTASPSGADPHAFISDGAVAAVERTKEKIFSQLRAQGAEFVHTDNPDVPQLPDDEWIGKMAVFVHTRSRDMSRAYVVPIVGRIVRTQVVMVPNPDLHLSWAKTSNRPLPKEIPMQTVVTLQTLEGVKEVYVSHRFYRHGPIHFGVFAWPKS